MVSRGAQKYGCLEYSRNYIDRTLGIIDYGDKSVKYVGRKAASSTATGI